ncbi:hypothetical protein K438DRAFT_1944350 [Mycena galopus ATCC 62051]|nr:hypothetical protein K438DRAFT_1944350 [Mycena galopus ATCC 62051]
MATTYSAWFATKKGTPSTSFQLKTGIPIPTKLPKGHVLLKVQAIGLNPLLIAIVPNFIARWPHLVPECDVAGMVVDGNGTEFKKGDLVFGGKFGVMAEYIVIPAASLVPKPPNVTPVEAAGVPLVLLVAYQAMANLEVRAGQTVFINGGTSSVGLSAIQLAKSMGCTVVATASARNKDLLLSLGVDEFIDYTRAPLVEQLLKRTSPKFNGIFDAVALQDPSMYLHCTSYLLPGGIYVTAGGLPSSRSGMRQFFEGFLRPSWLGGVPRKYKNVTVPRGKKDFEAIQALVAKDSVHSFDRAGVMAAYDKLMSKHAVGKVVIKVENES